MQAIILAGGFGTRLQSTVSNVPKPMAPIGDAPFLALLLDYLRSQNIREVVLSVHHLHEKISEFFGTSYHGIKIGYSVEEEPLGTGGAIKYSLAMLKPVKPVFVINGDTFVKVDMQKMYKKHLDKKAQLTIALRHSEDCQRYGQVTVEGGVIQDFLHLGNDGPGLINTGLYVINPSLFSKFSLNRAFSFERDFLYQHAPELQAQAFLAEDYFIDIGIPEDYARACKELPGIIGRPHAG